MRSLDECKAEIFRRSEIKIKQRKKNRNRVLAACIPLCLCISIGAAGVFSGAFGAKSENMAAAPESGHWNNGGNSLYLAESVGDDVCTSDSTLNRNPASIQKPEDSQYGERPIYGITTELKVTAESENYETLKEILLELDYSPHKVCRCQPQYTLNTDFGSYGIYLSEGYARCEEGQADLTAEQIQTLRQIIDDLTD